MESLKSADPLTKKGAASPEAAPFARGR